MHIARSLLIAAVIAGSTAIAGAAQAAELFTHGSNCGPDPGYEPSPARTTSPSSPSSASRTSLLWARPERRKHQRQPGAGRCVHQRGRPGHLRCFGPPQRRWSDRPDLRAPRPEERGDGRVYPGGGRVENNNTQYVYLNCHLSAPSGIGPSRLINYVVTTRYRAPPDRPLLARLGSARAPLGGERWGFPSLRPSVLRCRPCNRRRTSSGLGIGDLSSRPSTPSGACTSPTYQRPLREPRHPPRAAHRARPGGVVPEDRGGPAGRVLLRAQRAVRLAAPGARLRSHLAVRPGGVAAGRLRRRVRPPRAAGGSPGGRWLADVGFGRSFLEPLSLDAPSESEAEGRHYRVVPGDPDWTVEHRLGGAPPEPDYRFTLRSGTCRRAGRLQGRAGTCGPGVGSGNRALDVELVGRALVIEVDVLEVGPADRGAVAVVGAELEVPEGVLFLLGGHLQAVVEPDAAQRRWGC